MKKTKIHEQNSLLKTCFSCVKFDIQMNRLVQIKTVEAAPRNSQTQRRAAFQTLKRLLQIQLAIIRQMPQAHKIRSAQLQQLAIMQPQLTTKTAQKLR